MYIRSIWCVWFVALLSAGPVLASGFALFEHSSKGVALGGAMVAQADDPSALYYNPAGIVQLEGNSFLIGFSGIKPDADIYSNQSGMSYSTVDDTAFPPHLYYSRALNDKWFVGVGVFAPFGLMTEFDHDWEGRYNSYFAEVEAVNFNPNIAYKVNDQLSLAFGLSLVTFRVTLEQKIMPAAVVQSNAEAIIQGLMASQGIDLATATYVFQNQVMPAAMMLPDMDQSLEGDDMGYGFNFALRYQPSEKFAMGLSYRSKVDQDVDGDVVYQDVASSAAFPFFPFQQVFFDAKGTAEIELPEFIQTGFAFSPTENVTVEADFWRTGWSSYDQLAINFENGVGQRVVQKDWDDVWSYRFGLDYQLNEKVALRAGYIFDESPIPDEHIDYTLPSNDRDLYCLGAGFTLGQGILDLYISQLSARDREIEPRPTEFILDSELEADALLWGLSYTYHF